MVIGGGIVGTSIALHAADRGSPTVLVERDAAPQGASSSSFASITALDERSQDLYLLKAASLPAWHRWGKRLNGDVGLRWDGEIRWAQTRDGARELIDKIESARVRGYPARLISPSQLATRLPAARPEPVEVASFAPEDGQVEPQRVIAVARRALQEAGGRLVHGRGKVIVGETGVEVQVAEETITASTIVLATGAETASLTDKLGWDIPLAPSPGLLLTTTPAAPYCTSHGLHDAGFGNAHSSSSARRWARAHRRAKSGLRDREPDSRPCLQPPASGGTVLPRFEGG